MPDTSQKKVQLIKAVRELHRTSDVLAEHLRGKGFDVASSPNTKITEEMYQILLQDFDEDRKIREQQKHPQQKPEASETSYEKEVMIRDSSLAEKTEEVAEEIPEKKRRETFTEMQEKIAEPESTEKKAETPSDEVEVIRAKDSTPRLGIKVTGQIELPKEQKPKPFDFGGQGARRKRRKRKRKKESRAPGTAGKAGEKQDAASQSRQAGTRGRRRERVEPTEEEIQLKIKETLSRIETSKTVGSLRAKFRKEKREGKEVEATLERAEKQKREKILQVTEFVSANELANLMGISVNEVIAKCMSLGMFVSINQRLDAEALTVIADEFGYQVEFVKPEVAAEMAEEADNPEDLLPRPPIVTVMGHVDHGKTSLLDFIRKANVIAGEAGGITQHIGAYEVSLKDGKKITFLDTPGHEAFTAMRARGAQVTDIVIIVVAADDSVMPQTKEAVNHARAARVPIVIAINKIDKPAANPDKIREQLSAENVLVEEWGGKVQCQEIAAKQGKNVELLLEKVLLEADLLELKANPNRKASGTVIESRLDKGRGIIATVMIQNGTLRMGDALVAGSTYGKIKAMYDERQNRIKEAPPSTPVQVLGLTGMPQAGDKVQVMESERDARELTSKRQQLQREQTIRQQKHITLDEIGKRKAAGEFKELKIIVKADVDGSAEALGDSLLKLSTEEVQVNIIHKSVGAITENDVLLAAASDAVIVGFQVRPSAAARKLAETEMIDIRHYSIIYDAINEIKDALEGLLAPEVQEKVLCTAEVRDVFKITKVGTIAGCMVQEGTVKRNMEARILREGVVIYTGKINSLKRFKDDAREVAEGYECGIGIENFNDIKVSDVIEGFEKIEIKRTLETR